MRRPTIAALLPLLALQSSCGGDDDDEPAEPTPPPQLTILGILPAGGPPWEPPEPCVELGRDQPGLTVEVLVGPSAGADSCSLQDWSLRPPGACDARECGHLAVRIDPQGATEQLLVRSSCAAVPVPLGQLDSPQGSHTFRVELRNDDGSSTLDEAGAAISAEVTLLVAAPGGCGEGSGGAAGAAGSAGAGGEQPSSGGAAGTAGAASSSSGAGAGGAAAGAAGTAGAASSSSGAGAGGAAAGAGGAGAASPSSGAGAGGAAAGAAGAAGPSSGAGAGGAAAGAGGAGAAGPSSGAGAGGTAAGAAGTAGAGGAAGGGGVRP